MKKTVYLNERDSFLYHGRHLFFSNMLLLDWSGSGFSFNFKGTGFNIFFGEHSGEQPVYIRVEVDGGGKCGILPAAIGGSSARFAVSNGKERVVIDGLSDRRHTVRVIRITEGADKLCIRGVEIDGEMLPPPLESVRRIEFLGDSITCGYGILGDESTTAFNTYEEDSSLAWAYTVAEKFGADAHFECISGKGIVCNCEGAQDITFSKFFQIASRGGEPWNFASWVPQAVVINGGTNDGWGGATAEQFEQGASELISLIRSKYTYAQIIWCYGLMGDVFMPVLKKLFKKLGESDQKLHLLPLAPLNPKKGEIGGVGHPSIKANNRVASAVIAKLKSLKIW